MPVSFTFSLAPAAGSSSSSSPTPGSEAGATAGRDLKLDPTTGDLELLEGDFELVAGGESIASDLASRLQTFAGEWFLDTSIGLPYFTEIAGRPTKRRLDELFRAAINETPGVTEVLELGLTQTGRTLSLAFRVATDLGILIDASLEAIPAGA
jgi:hypothetical protein